MDKYVARIGRVIVSAALFSVLIIVAISCAADDSTVTVVETVIVEREVEVVETVIVEKEVQKPESKPLVIYSGRSESLIGPLIADFEEVTGEKVQVNYGKTGMLAATLLEEGGNTPADIYFAQDPGGLGAVDSLLAELSTEILESVPDWARDPESKWVGTSGRARVVVYNTDMLTEADLPDSIEDFVKPEWKGRIGWAPTNSSLHAMITGKSGVRNVQRLGSKVS